MNATRLVYDWILFIWFHILFIFVDLSDAVLHSDQLKQILRVEKVMEGDIWIVSAMVQRARSNQNQFLHQVGSCHSCES